MTEAAVKKRFRAYKRLMIELVGREPMDDLTIDRIGREVFGKAWAGVAAADVPLTRSRRPRYAVVNTATSRGRGSHWIGLYMDGSTAWLYDSFGRKPAQVSWRVSRAAEAAHVSLASTDPAAEQRGSSAVCGQLSLSWLLTVQDFGIAATAAAV